MRIALSFESCSIRTDKDSSNSVVSTGSSVPTNTLKLLIATYCYYASLFHSYICVIWPVRICQAALHERQRRFQIEADLRRFELATSMLPLEHPHRGYQVRMVISS